jgi:hypothetical protein
VHSFPRAVSLSCLGSQTGTYTERDSIRQLMEEHLGKTLSDQAWEYAQKKMAADANTNKRSPANAAATAGQPMPNQQMQIQMQQPQMGTPGPTAGYPQGRGPVPGVSYPPHSQSTKTDHTPCTKASSPRTRSTSGTL